MAKLNVAVFGTCRVHDPLRSMESEGRAVRVNDPAFGFMHTPQEIMQAITLLRGRKALPSQLSDLVSVDHPAALEEAGDLFDIYYGHADAIAVEISSMRYIRYDGWILQRDRLRERLSKIGVDLGVCLRDIASGADLPPSIETVIREHDPFLADVLRSCEAVTMSADELKSAVHTLLDLFDKPIILVGHFVDTGPFKGVNPIRATIRDVLADVADHHPNTIFVDPTLHIAEFGFERALADGSHYTKRYGVRAGDKLVRAAREVIKTAPRRESKPASASEEHRKPTYQGTRLNAVLFGGSNSVMRHGLKYGMAAETNLTNLALGASSSSQNLHAALSDPAALAAADFIVTESNVNDSHAVASVGCDPRVVEASIDSLYALLAATGKPVFTLILPHRAPLHAAETPKLIARLNRRHRLNAGRYGIYGIDLAHHWSHLPDDRLAILQPDARHPHHTIMVQIALNITRWVRDNRLSSAPSAEMPTSRYQPVKIADLDQAEVETKANNAFAAGVRDVARAPVTFPSDFWGRRLVAIETWSDGPSVVHVTADGKHVFKPVNASYAFNEFKNPILIGPETRISSPLTSDFRLTEKSLNVDRISGPLHPAKVAGFLIQSDAPRIDWNDITIPDMPDRCDLIPDIDPYLTAHDFFLRRLAAMN